MDEQHGPTGDDADDCCAGRSSTPGIGRSGHARRRSRPHARAHHRLPRARGSVGRSRPTSPTGRAPAARSAPTSRCACPATSTSATPARVAGRGGLRRAGPRPARRPAGRRHRAGHWREPLQGPSRRRLSVWTARWTSRSACRPIADAGRPRGAGQAHHGGAGLRRAHAGRGSPADGHRLRPAGRRARLSAARRSRTLPGGLLPSWPPSTPAGWPSASTTRRRRCRFLELSGDDFPETG